MNPLIFGKHETERIVSFEIKDSEATLFIETDKGVNVVAEPNKFWTLSRSPIGRSAKRMKGDLHYKYAHVFDSEEEWRNFNRQAQRKNADIYTVWNPKENSQLVKGHTSFKGMTPKDVSVLSWDLETSGLVHDHTSQIYIIANVYRKGETEIKKLFCFDEYSSQKEMIETWCSWVREMDPSILLAYNGNYFDIPYLLHVASNNDCDVAIGRDGSNLTTRSKESQFRKDGSQSYGYFKPICYGREIIDQMFVAIRYDIARKYESYALKQIVRQEGLEKADRTFIDASKLSEIVKDPEQWKLAKAYALDDAEDSLKLFDKMIPAQFYAANSIPRPFQLITESSTGAQLNGIMVREYLRNFHSVPKADQIPKFAGGTSFAVPGIYKNLLKVDLKSAYPSQILRFKLQDYKKDPLNVFYRMVEYFTYERFDLKDKFKETGDKYYSDREQASKLVINSAYGLCGTNGLNFNSPQLANKITYETRKVLDDAIKWASGHPDKYWIRKFKEATGKEIDDA
jgi:DNA polymerase, archaea type